MPNWGAVRGRIERACFEPVTSKQLRVSVLGLLRPVVPFDAYVWLLTDPVTRVGTVPLADIPGLPWTELPALIRQRYLAGEDWFSFRPEGAVDVFTSLYVDRFGCWGWLDLWRTGVPFTPVERSFIASLEPALTTALRTAQARTFTDAPADGEPPGAAVFLLDADLRPTGHTNAALSALLRLNPPDHDIPLVPAAAYNVGAALLAGEAGRWAVGAWSRVHLTRGHWVTLSAARMGSADIAVAIEPSTTAQRREVFALAHALTARERQVLDELATGADSSTIAGRLVISEHTVNDHVKAILTKSSASTRARLLARLTG